jgi:hypothetical protein
MNKTISKEIKSLSPDEKYEGKFHKIQSTIKSPSYSPVKRSVYIGRLDGIMNTDNGVCASQPKVIIPTTVETDSQSPLYLKNRENSPSQPSNINLSKGTAPNKLNTTKKLFNDENIQPIYNFQNVHSPTSNPPQINKTTPLANKNLSSTLQHNENTPESPLYHNNGENTASPKAQPYFQNLKSNRSPLRDKTNSPNNISPNAVRTLTRTKNIPIDVHTPTGFNSPVKPQLGSYGGVENHLPVVSVDLQRMLALMGSGLLTVGMYIYIYIYTYIYIYECIDIHIFICMQTCVY